MSRTIAIASGKGGVGKTFLAIGLAQALAETDRRVLLVDAAWGLANVDVQLGLVTDRHLGMGSEGGRALRDLLVREPRSGLVVLPGASGSRRLADLPPAAVAGFLGELAPVAAGFDVTLLDLGAGIQERTALLARTASEVLVVVTAEPTSLTDAYAFVKVACRRHAAVRVVVNLAETAAAGLETFATLRQVARRFLGMELGLAGIVRRDPRVQGAIREQVPLLSRHPTSDAAADLRKLATALTGRAPGGERVR